MMDSILKVSRQVNSCTVVTKCSFTKVQEEQQYTTVLAWLKTHLSIYIELNLLNPTTPDLTNVDYWLGKPILCLAHHFFPEAFDNQDILNQLNNSQGELAIGLFHDRLQVAMPKDKSMEYYFQQIRDSIIEKNAVESAMRDLHVGSTIDDSLLDQTREGLLLPLMRLYHQSLELVRQESLATAARSPRISMDMRPQPYIYEMSWKEIASQFHQLDSKFQALQQSRVHSHPDLTTCLSAVHAAHASLESQLQKGLQNSISLEFSTNLSMIRNELDFAQSKLLKLLTTDASIRDVELRLAHVGSLIENTRVQFQDCDAQQYDIITEKHQLILSWVNDVRYWYMEAERVRTWAEECIKILETKQIAYDRIECQHYSTEQIHAWNNEYAELQRKIKAQDMTQLRAHVKKLTLNGSMNPADASVIEITYTALMTFDRLTHGMKHHRFELQLVDLRMTWENSYQSAMRWILDMEKSTTWFLQQEARWHDIEKNTMVTTLIGFEQQVSEQEEYAAALCAYREFDDVCHIELPAHVQSRQRALELAFTDLTQRISWTRQIVEQYAMVSDLLSNADTLMTEGELLKQEMESTTSDHILEFNERVTRFQEHMMGLITGVASRVPYPEGRHTNEETNEAIRIAIGTRKSKLLALGEQLDQGITLLRRAVQSQKRVKQLQNKTHQWMRWTNERLKSIEKSNIDVLSIGKCGLDLDTVSSLVKEADGQIVKVDGVIANDLRQLKDSIQSLSTYGVLEQVQSLNKDSDLLEIQLSSLKDSIKARHSKLDVLGRRILWETQHAKAIQWVSCTTLQVWDFITHKAQWKMAVTIDEDCHSNCWESMVKEEWKSLLHKTQDFRDNQLASVHKALFDMKSGFDMMENNDSVSISNHLQYRQNILDQDYDSLNDLITFAEKVIYQHFALKTFTTQVFALKEHGEQLILLVQNSITRVMNLDNYADIIDKVTCFSTDVTQLWTDTQIPYPQCPANAYATRPSTDNDNMSNEIANTVYKMHSSLQELVKKLLLLLQSLKIAMVYRVKIEEWCLETRRFIQMLTSCTDDISAYEFDFGSSVMIYNNKQEVTLDVCRMKETEFLQQIEQYKTDFYGSLKVQCVRLCESCKADGCVTIDLELLQRLWVDADQHCETLLHTFEKFGHKVLVCSSKLDWYHLFEKLFEQLSRLRTDVQNWDSRKSAWTAKHNEQDKMDLYTLVDQCDTFSQMLDSYIQHSRPQLIAQHNTFLSACNKYDVKSDSLDNPEQDTIDELCISLKEMLSIRKSEIQNILKQYEWEALADYQLELCQKRQMETECFIENNARWRASTPSMDKDALNNLQRSNREHITTIEKHINEKPSISTESIYSRCSNLISAVECMRQHDEFLRQVISQHETMCELVNKFVAIKSEAEAMKSRFSSLDSPPSDELEKYKSAVSEFCNSVDMKMIYPVRDHDISAREKDVAHNDSLKEILGAHQTYLMDTQKSLQDILKSKQSTLHVKAAEESYFTEAAELELWIRNQLSQIDLCEEGSLVEDLKKAVGHMKNLKDTISASSLLSNLGMTANRCLVSIQQQEGDDNYEEICNSKTSIETKHNELETSWQDLLDIVSKTHSDISHRLKRAQFLDMSALFKTRSKELQDIVNITDLNDISDECSLQWKNQIKVLQNDLLEHVSSMVDAAWQAEYDDLALQFQELKTQVQDMVTEANLHKLKNSYFKSADSFKRSITQIGNSLKTLLKEPLAIQGRLEQDTLNLESLLTIFTEIRSQVNHQQDVYDKHCSLYKALRLDNVPDIDFCQQELTLQWEQIKSEIVVADQGYITPMNQWMELHAKLNDIKVNSLNTILDRLNHFDKMGNKTPNFFARDIELLNSMIDLASECYDVAESLNQKEVNMPFFKEKYNVMLDSIQKVNELLMEKKALVQQEIEFKSLQASVQSVLEKISDQVREIENERTKVIDSDLESICEAFSKAIAQRVSIQGTIHSEIDLLKQRIHELAPSYQDVNLLDQVNQAQKKLNCALTTSKITHDFLKLVLEHDNKAGGIMLWINSCQSAIRGLDNKNLGGVTILTEKMKAFENADIKQFNDLSEEIIHMPIADCCNDIWESIKVNIMSKMNHVNDQWGKLTENAKQAASKINRVMDIVGKIEGLESLIDEAKCHIKEMGYLSESDDDDKTQVEEEEENSVLNPDKDNEEMLYDSLEESSTRSSLSSMPRRTQVEDFQNSLRHIESELLPHIGESMEELDRLVGRNKTDLDLEILQCYHKLEDSVVALKDACQCKNAALQKSLMVGSYLTTADNIEMLQNSLEETMNQITSSIHEPLNRTTLKVVLTDLDAHFKYYERRLVPALLEAREKASQVDSSAVKEHLEGIEKRWEWTKTQFKVCKIELGRSIDIDGQDQQARFRKSSLPTRKLSPTTSTLSSSSFSSKASAIRLSQQSPKTTVPSIVKSPLPNSYVPDPKNILDVEIGRIVNAIPYKVEVKIAPGGPGRYWFGKVNPKLCYCRILKSKMVMVRVGGGWAELSQFLKNHTLLEGEFVPKKPHKNNTVHSNIMIEEEDTPSIMKEGFLTTHQAVLVDLSPEGDTKPRTNRSRIAKRIVT